MPDYTNITSQMSQQSNSNSKINPNNPYSYIRDNVKFIQSLEVAETTKETGLFASQPQVHERLHQMTQKAQRYGLIASMNEETRQMSLERFSARLPSVKQNNRYHQFKEKRETSKDYVETKRSIFKASLRISMKKEESEKLNEFLKEEK